MQKTKSTNSSVTKTAQIFVAKRTHLTEIKKGDLSIGATIETNE